MRAVLPYGRTYALGETELRTLAAESCTASRIDDLLTNCFSFLPQTSSSEKPVSLTFGAGTAMLEMPPEVTPVYRDPRLQVFTVETHSYILSGPSWARLAFLEGDGDVSLDDGFWSAPLEERINFVTLCLLWLFRSRGLYALHANSLERAGKGLLVVGRSGSGKTTSTIALSRSGWNYVSDDVTILERVRGAVVARSFSKTLSFDGDLDRRLRLSRAPQWSSRAKTAARFDTVLSGSVTPVCTPRLMVFPHIAKGPSQTTRLSPRDAFIRLMEHSGGLTINRAMAKDHLAVLSELATEVPGFEMKLGRDLYREPGRLTRYIDEVVAENAEGPNLASSGVGVHGSREAERRWEASS